jgi:hypothetical protein
VLYIFNDISVLISDSNGFMVTDSYTQWTAQWLKFLLCLGNVCVEVWGIEIVCL